MPDTPPARRRWYQFGLRELFWLTLVVAILLFALNERRERGQSEGDPKVR
jgi:hypothetical protein